MGGGAGAISGGDVEVYGGCFGGTGIGGGMGSQEGGAGATVKITGGTVCANGGKYNPDEHGGDYAPVAGVGIGDGMNMGYMSAGDVGTLSIGSGMPMPVEQDMAGTSRECGRPDGLTCNRAYLMLPPR